MKRTVKIRDLTYIAMAAALIAVCAWLQVPMVPPLVPFTMQTFAVFTVVMTLGWRRGLAAVGVYILLGAVGLPVFSGFKGGIAALLGTTGGYILGFVALCLVYGLFPDRLRFWGCWVGMLACYAFGTVWFYIVYLRTTGPVGISTVLAWCVAPYLLPDFCKLLLAYFLSNRLRRYTNLIQS